MKRCLLHFDGSLWALLTALTLSPLSFGQSSQEALSKASADLEQAVRALADTRSEIATEKVPLVRKISRIEDAVRETTEELNRQQRLRDNRDLGLNRLRVQVEATRTQNEYISGLLDEFVRNFETRIDFAETQIHGAIAEEARLILEDRDAGGTAQLGAQMTVVSSALERLDALLGGYQFDGVALSPSGEIESGRFAVFGPTVFFASAQSDLSGITFSRLNAAQPAIASLPGTGAGIRAFVREGEGRVPLDGTLGRALRIEESKDSLFEHLAKGGAVGYAIVGLGILCLFFASLKFFEINSFKTPSSEDLRTVLSHLEANDTVKAKASAAAVPGAGGKLLEAGVDNCKEKRGNLEEILLERILAGRPQLERFLPFLALAAAAAPLLGLLGTVTGMIKTFNLITIFGTGDAKSLSSGISEALVTTELGLIVAIPAPIRIRSAVAFLNGVATMHKHNA